MTVGTSALALRAETAIQKVPAGAPVKLWGWGANLRVDCYLSEPGTRGQVALVLDRSGSVARGLGRSYGDAAINAGGQVMGMKRLTRYLDFDEEAGTLECESGVSLEQIIRDFGPRGWFPMITPGTKLVTIGGCIANDVHGKAHHAQGTFMTCVDSMQVLLASGEVVVASREENSELFYGSFGGMGLLGIVLSAKLRLRKIETTYFKQRSIVVPDLASMLAALDEQDRLFPYSVATLDIFATGAQLGRGVLTVGDHAAQVELPAKLAQHPLRIASPLKVSVPFEMPEFALNSLSMRLVNALIMRIQAGAQAFGHYEGFFYPLDRILHWNRGYGRRGFTQYQFVIPFADGERNLRNILTTILSAGQLPFLNVLKRMGKANEGLLSFPQEGYTLAIDFPIRAGTPKLMKQLDKLVLDAGGRVYLGKDSFLAADDFRAMYGNVNKFLELKSKLDPHHVFTSNLARRLELG